MITAMLVNPQSLHLPANGRANDGRQRRHCGRVPSRVGG
jgi:hypothetical protein